MRQKSPQVDEILSNHRGVQFVEFAADRMYWLLYKFVWESPRVHANCGGRITYKTTEPNVIVSTRFYCGKCGEIVNPETWENTIYIKPSLHKVHDSDA